jgi:hypothetical protein
MDDKTKSLFTQLKRGPQGTNFIEWLEDEKEKNYHAFLISEADMNEVHKGIGLSLKKLLDTLKNCDSQ